MTVNDRMLAAGKRAEPGLGSCKVVQGNCKNLQTLGCPGAHWLPREFSTVRPTPDLSRSALLAWILHCCLSKGVQTNCSHERKAMNYVYGPVPSRRLGESLGIDPIPFKTCNWNCVYCQLGGTSPLTNERREFFLQDEILAEVQSALTSQDRDKVDWLTFVGTGEPTLHAGLGEMIRRLKCMTDIPIAVITNGSLLYLPEVRRELEEANAVLPTLDAGNEKLYRRINRPHPRLGLDRHVDGLTAFRQEFRGDLWVEVMLIRGLNDTVEALS